MFFINVVISRSIPKDVGDEYINENDLTPYFEHNVPEMERTFHQVIAEEHHVPSPPRKFNH